MSTVKKLSNLNSGYTLSDSYWVEFIECWWNKYNVIQGNNFSLPSLILLKPEVGDQFNSVGFQNNLTLEIPRSLEHFYKAYIKLGGQFISVSDADSIGFYLPSELSLLADFDAEVAYVEQQWLIESSDEKYYKYGIKQDTSTGRNSYLKGALVIGRYGDSSNELILLYPNSQTEDGEMEAAILSYASEFRTPSFAEMMRQLSFLFLQNQDSLPPYAQNLIADTCADKLPLKDVWWE